VESSVESAELASLTCVFGSRATGRARRYSDLDPAIDAGRQLTLDEIAGPVDAFREGDLPLKVDLVDWHDVRSMTPDSRGRTRSSAPDRTPRRWRISHAGQLYLASEPSSTAPANGAIGDIGRATVTIETHWRREQPPCDRTLK
jgi:predicted nucleotidyltransferase